MIDASEVALRRNVLHERYGVPPARIKDVYLAAAHFYDVLENLETYGFACAQIGRIVGKHPRILHYSLERTDAVLKNLESQALTKAEVIGMVTAHPAVIGSAPERTNSLMALLLECDVDFVRAPHRLIRNPEGLRRRTQVMRDGGYDPKKDHWVLFETNERFAARFGVEEETAETAA